MLKDNEEQVSIFKIRSSATEGTEPQSQGFSLCLCGWIGVWRAQL